MSTTQFTRNKKASEWQWRMRYEILWSLHEKYFYSTLRILKVLFLVNSGISSVSVIKFQNKSDRGKRSTFPHVWMFPSIYCLHIFKQKELNWYEVATKIIKDVQHTGKCRVEFIWKGKKEEKGKWENVAELTGWCDLFREQKKKNLSIKWNRAGTGERRKSIKYSFTRLWVNECTTHIYERERDDAEAIFCVVWLFFVIVVVCCVLCVLSHVFRDELFSHMRLCVEVVNVSPTILLPCSLSHTWMESVRLGRELVEGAYN